MNTSNMSTSDMEMPGSNTPGPNTPEASLIPLAQSPLTVRFHEIGTIPEWHITFVVLLARYQGKWVYARHKERNTWEMPGGHREPGEWLNDSAERELYEETGAKRFTLDPLCDYEVDRSGGETTVHPNAHPDEPLSSAYFQVPSRTFGRLYLTEIQELGKLPASEIAEASLFDHPPEDQTYPSIQPHLHSEGMRRLACEPVSARESLLRLISPLLLNELRPFSLMIGLPEAAIGEYACITRQAVRLVAIRNGRILLVRNRREDVKFPGGGIESDETDLEALKRECREETGYALVGIPRLFGKVVERHFDGKNPFSVFEMTSRYYVGEVGDRVCAQELDDYEAAMAFEPAWMTVTEACENNLRLVDGPESGRNRWVVRDTAVLVLIEQLLQKKPNPETW